MEGIKLGLHCAMCAKLTASPVYSTSSSSLISAYALHFRKTNAIRWQDSPHFRRNVIRPDVLVLDRPLRRIPSQKRHGIISFRGLLGHARFRGSRRKCEAVASVGGTPHSSLRVASDVLQLSTFESPLPLPPPPSDMSIFSVLPYLWTLAASDRALQWRMGLALLLLVTSKICGLSGPVLFKRAIDMLSEASSKHLTEQAVFTALFWLAASNISKALAAVLNEMRYVVFTPVGQSTGRRVALHFFDHIMRMDMAFHLDQKTGGLSRIMDRGKRSVAMIFRAVVFTFIPTMVELVLVCALLARNVSSLFAATVLLTFLFYVAWTVALTKAAANSRKEVNRLDTLTVGKIVDSLINFETVVQFNNQELESQEYNGLLKSYQDAAVEADKISATLNAGQSMILALGMATVMAMAGQRVARGAMTVGDLVFVNGLILQLSVPLQFLGFLYRDLRQSLVDMEQMFTILKLKPSTKDGTVHLPKTSEGAAFHGTDLKFGYSSNRQVLKGVSLRAEPGQSVAVVGPSGSGKSTLVKLLLRLYDATEGKIFIDGHEIRTLNLESLRNTVAVVPQDTVLFNDTLFHNIAYGRPSATREEVLFAARQARLDSAVDRMPEGYDTVVGERGLKLSGGEKQRVAIARAFLKSPRLLICDEATSALDSETEAAILKSLKELAAGRTCLFIAHRLSTIKHCDRIIVMENGVVAEEGSHEHLLAKKGMYASMWALQESESKVLMDIFPPVKADEMSWKRPKPTAISTSGSDLVTQALRSSIDRGVGGVEFGSGKEWMKAVIRTQESDSDDNEDMVVSRRDRFGGKGVRSNGRERGESSKGVENGHGNKSVVGKVGDESEVVASKSLRRKDMGDDDGASLSTDSRT